jgi:2-polyprenyl-3-methyl-5-hydroxy-6-metoxy-1,4-benzoquinol methylase
MSFFTTCPFCDGSLISWWLRPSFSKCRVCRLVLRNPSPEPEPLAEHYAESWSDPDAHLNETGGMDFGLATQYTRDLLKSLGLSDAVGLRILDFGAGRGFLMSALAAAGATVWGIEPYGFDGLRAQGQTVFRTLEALPPGLAFDGIVSMDVLEHLYQPWHSIAALARLLVPGGWLCLSTPNPRGLNARLMQSRWRETHNQGHLMFMEEYCLMMMLKQANLSRGKGVRWSIRHQNSLVRHGVQRLLERVGLGGTVRVIAVGGDSGVP